MDTYENEYLSQYYVQESDVFRRKIDSLMNEKLKIWELFNKSVNQKKLSSNITKSSIKYNYYNKLERYAILRGTNWTKSKRESYYDFIYVPLFKYLTYLIDIVFINNFYRFFKTFTCNF